MAAEEKDTPPAKKLPRPPWWMVGLVLVLLGFALFGDKGVINTLRMLEYKASLKEKIEQLEADNAELRREIHALRNDHSYLEALARKELGMVKEDELIYQFPPAPPSPALSPRSSTATSGQ